MGANDYHFANGKLRPGLVNTEELQGVVAEIDDVEHAEAVLETLREQIDNLRYKELPMLKGKGFVVVNPTDGRFSGEEYEDLEDAQHAASNVAYTTSAGYAIVYAPIAVLRPKRDTAISQPSELLKQINKAKLLAGEVAPEGTKA